MSYNYLSFFIIFLNTHLEAITLQSLCPSWCENTFYFWKLSYSPFVAASYTLSSLPACTSYSEAIPRLRVTCKLPAHTALLARCQFTLPHLARFSWDWLAAPDFSLFGCLAPCYARIIAYFNLILMGRSRYYRARPCSKENFRINWIVYLPRRLDSSGRPCLYLANIWTPKPCIPPRIDAKYSPFFHSKPWKAWRTCQLVFADDSQDILKFETNSPHCYGEKISAFKRHLIEFISDRHGCSATFLVQEISCCTSVRSVILVAKIPGCVACKLPPLARP